MFARLRCGQARFGFTLGALLALVTGSVHAQTPRAVFLAPANSGGASEPAPAVSALPLPGQASLGFESGAIVPVSDTTPATAPPSTGTAAFTTEALATQPFRTDLPPGSLNNAAFEKALRDLEARHEQVRRNFEDLSHRYEVLSGEVKKNEKKIQEAEHPRSEKKESAFEGGAGQGPARVRKEPMYHIGWFWWRDNTKEIEGRDPYHADMEPHEHEISEGVHFGDGLSWTSQDKYFKFVFHDLTQLDLREPLEQGQPLHGGFIIPRQRWYFEGKVGDFADFVTSINRGYGSLDVLDSYVDFNVNREYLKFRVGRFKMPSQYEYIDIAEGDLLGPERSLYVANFAANRQLGAMAHGYLFERLLHYYVAMSNGPRRSFEDYNSSFDFFFYGDFMPFTNNPDSIFKDLHLVSAVNFGEERNSPSPNSVQTLNQDSVSAASLTVSPTIWQFNTSAIENGPRLAWSQELVYYYKSFGIISGVQGGYQDYSVATTSKAASGFVNASGDLLGVGSPYRTHVPIAGGSFGFWYFLTGEEITRRRFLVEPIRPFGFYNGTINPGAWEFFSRVADLQAGGQLFQNGLVNKADWTNRAVSLDVGLNWYINHFLKITFDYQHTFLGNDVILDPTTGRRTGQYDMFLVRTQLFF